MSLYLVVQVSVKLGGHDRFCSDSSSATPERQTIFFVVVFLALPGNLPLCIGQATHSTAICQPQMSSQEIYSKLGNNRMQNTLTKMLKSRLEACPTNNHPTS